MRCGYESIHSGTGAAGAGVFKEESKATEATFPSEPPTFGQPWGKKSVAATTPKPFRVHVGLPKLQSPTAKPQLNLKPSLKPPALPVHAGHHSADSPSTIGGTSQGLGFRVQGSGFRV